MNMITTRTPTVRAHMQIVPDGFSLAAYPTAAAQDKLREKMAASVEKQFRVKTAAAQKPRASKFNAEQLAECKRNGKINRGRILAALAIRNRSREAIKAELGMTPNQIKTAFDVLYGYGFVKRVGSAPLLSGRPGTSAVIAITPAGRAALAEGRA